MNNRQMVGLADLTGKIFGTLRVLRMVSRHPLPLWLVHCDRCGYEWGEAHSTFQRGAVLCRNATCVKEQEHDARRKVGLR